MLGKRKHKEKAADTKAREQVAASKKRLTREDVYHKPILAKAYDKMNPGDYTIRQDFYHSLFLFGFIVVAFACIITMIIVTGLRSDYQRSDELLIPATTFTKGQEENVTEILGGYGFSEIVLDSAGNIVAKGTPEMVKAYEDSFYERNVGAVQSLMEEGFIDSGTGIDTITVSDDFKTMRINSYRELTENSSTLKSAVGNEDVAKVIQAYADWCAMRNGGEAMKIEFVNLMDLTDGSNGTVYYTTTQPTGEMILAEWEDAQADKEESKDDEDDKKDSKSKDEKGEKAAKSSK